MTATTQQGPGGLTFEVVGTGERVTLKDFRTVVAGYTGRDEAAVHKHIAELAAIGVPAPDSIPAFYPVDSRLVTQEATVRVSGSNTSGEVEPVLVRVAGELFLTVGSDHTDRDLERTSIAAAKQACPKPVSRQLVRLPPAAESFDWDAVHASSSVDGTTYQSGVLGSLRVPSEVLAMYDEVAGQTQPDVVMFGGTLPLLDGKFVAGSRWEMALTLSDSTVIQHAYTVVTAEHRP